MNRMKGMKPGDIVVHKDNRNRYTILDLIRVKVNNGNWVDGVLYHKEVNDGGIYARTALSFKRSFDHTGENVNTDKLTADPILPILNNSPRHTEILRRRIDDLEEDYGKLKEEYVKVLEEHVQLLKETLSTAHKTRDEN